MNNPYDEIVSYLCVGGQAAVAHYDKFALVVHCSQTLPADHPQMIWVPVNDTPDDASLMVKLLLEHQVLEHIHACVTAHQPVLVHCRMGMQRSCAVVACYLIKYNFMTPESAMAFIRYKRPVAFFGGANFERAMYAFTEAMMYASAHVGSTRIALL